MDPQSEGDGKSTLVSRSNSEDINKRIIEISGLAENTAREVGSVVTTCETLNELSRQLRTQLAQFKV